MTSLPALRILPGLDGTTRMLDGFVAQAHAAGFDDAAAIGYPHDRVLDADGLEAFAREQLPGDRPFVLLGESFSGPIALRIAADPPPMLRALVLSTTFWVSESLSVIPSRRRGTCFLLLQSTRKDFPPVLCFARCRERATFLCLCTAPRAARTAQPARRASTAGASQERVAQRKHTPSVAPGAMRRVHGLRGVFRQDVHVLSKHLI